MTDSVTKDTDAQPLSYISTSEPPPPYQLPCQYFLQQCDECSNQVPLLHILPPEYSTLPSTDSGNAAQHAPVVFVDCHHHHHADSVKNSSSFTCRKIVCKKRQMNSRLLNVILATCSCAFANPLFGVIAFILIMMAERASSEKSARKFDRASLAVAVVGCITGPIFIAVTLIVITQTTNPTPPPCIECDVPDLMPYQLAVTEPPVSEASSAPRWNRGRWGFRTTDRSPSGGTCDGYLVHGACYIGRYKVHCYHGSNCCQRPTQLYYAGFCYYASNKWKSGGFASGTAG